MGGANGTDGGCPVHALAQTSAGRNVRRRECIRGVERRAETSPTARPVPGGGAEGGGRWGCLSTERHLAGISREDGPPGPILNLAVNPIPRSSPNPNL